MSRYNTSGHQFVEFLKVPTAVYREDRWKAKCECGWNSPAFRTQSNASSSLEIHLADVKHGLPAFKKNTLRAALVLHDMHNHDALTSTSKGLLKATHEAAKREELPDLEFTSSLPLGFDYKRCKRCGAALMRYHTETWEEIEGRHTRWHLLVEGR